MKLLPEVYGLVQSFSLSEKRYFQIASSANAGKKAGQYLQLFSELEQFQEFDREAILDGLHQKGLGKFLSADLAYLEKVLLRTLRNFHSGKSVQARIREHITHVELFMARGLMPSALRHLGKARRLALKYEKTGPLLEILELESLLAKQLKGKQMLTRLDALRAEKMRVIEQLRLEFECSDLYNKVYAMQVGDYHLRSAQQKEEVKRILAHPALQEDNAAHSFHSRHLKWQIRSICGVMLGDASKTYEANRQAVLHWQAHPAMAQNEPDKFQRILANYLASCFESERLEAVPEVLSEMADSLAGDGSSPIRRIWYYYQFLYFLRKGEYDAGLALIPEIEQWIREHPTAAVDTWRIPIYFNFLTLMFLAEKFSLAARFCRKLLEDEGEKLRKDLLRGVRIVQLVIQLEAGEADFLEYLLRSAREFFRDADTYAFERKLIRFIGKMNRKPLADRKPRLWVAFISELEQVPEPEVPFFEEIRIWLKARAESISLVEAVKK